VGKEGIMVSFRLTKGREIVSVKEFMCIHERVVFGEHNIKIKGSIL